MRIENCIVTVLPPPALSIYPIANCRPGLARILLPKLEEFDSLWELTNSICDRYLSPVVT